MFGPVHVYRESRCNGEITDVHLVLDVEGDMFLGFEQLKPEGSAAAVKDPELNYLSRTEIAAA